MRATLAYVPLSVCSLFAAFDLTRFVYTGRIAFLVAGAIFAVGAWVWAPRNPPPDGVLA